MRKFISNLFSTKTTKPTSRKVHLSLNAMEDRYAPAMLLSPGTIRGFDPQPEPPHTTTAQISTVDAGTTRGIIVVGG